MREDKKRALIIVDVQNDFCPGGSLAVPRGDEVVPAVNHLMFSFKRKIFTKDWHSENHCSFKEWPRHCVQDSWGAEFHSDLKLPKRFTLVLKGVKQNEDGYSGFENTPLEGILRSKKVKEVHICGLATDYCVKATALDAQKLGFETFVILDACRGVNVKKGDVGRAVREMRKAGIKIITSKEV